VVGQLATFHAPRDVRLAFCIADDRLADWDWAKWLPHAQATERSDGAGPARLVAGNLDELAALLGTELGDRPSFTKQDGMGYDDAHIVVVVDGGRTYGDTRLTGRYGVTMLDVGHQVPSATVSPLRLSLHVSAERLGMITEDGIALLGAADRLTAAEAEALARQLAPRYTVTPARTDTPLSSTLGLPALLGIGDPRDIDPAVMWRAREPRDRLRLPLGVDPEGQTVDLDLKESAEGGMGPHGLVIGATGSGKSELLRTLVTGLAVTHSPENVNLALIDFKGGATFAGLSGLPHTCAVITNLADDLALVDRMADALRGEMMRRQELLHASGNYASVRDYEKARAAGAQLAPLPALLVIIDEFSELLSSRPEFIDLFVMIGRLGRSLAIHLLLASQRLEEGRLRGLDSHLSYRIGLRTFSAAESRTVLGVPDAYELPAVPGSAFLKMDTAKLVRFKAAYVSGDLPARGQSNGVVAPRRLAPFTLRPVPDQPAPTPAVEGAAAPKALRSGNGTGQSVMDAMITPLAGKGAPVHQIWLPPLDEPPTLDALLPPLGVDPERGLTALGWGGNGRLVVPVALVDKPFEQRRDLYWADLAGAAGHVIVCGAPQSGKSTLLRSLIGMLALTHTPREVQFFVLDMGGGALSPIAGLPHVSGYATRRDGDRCRRTVAELASLLAAREQAFAARGIDSITTFRQRRAEFADIDPDGRQFGDVFLVIDDWMTLRQQYEPLEEAITALAARGLGFGVHVVVSTGRWMAVRAPLRDAIGTRLELRLGDPADSVIDRRTAQNVPADRPGRGVTPDKLHFLAALPRIDGDQRPAGLAAGTADLVQRINDAWTGEKAPSVRLLPARVPMAELTKAAANPPSDKAIPIGIAEADLQPAYLDFGADPHFLAFGDVEAGKTNLLQLITRGITERYTPDEAAIIVADYRRGLLETVPEPYLLGYGGAEPVLTGLIAEVEQAMRQRLPGPDVTPDQLRERSWWRGPELFVVVDDYELVASSGRGPLLPLVEFLPQSRDIGLHLIIARASGGAARAMYEPVIQRVRELGTPGLVMSGSKDEGVLLGDVKCAPQPPGRGNLVRRRAATSLVQVGWCG
jgi:S-DNA-T family DNA segregation ATPase FtsK/SpoIIIE